MALRLRRLSAGLAAVLLFLTMLSACRDDITTGKSFRLPLDGEPRQLDPQYASDRHSTTVLTALFEGLTRLDETGAPVPGAATWSLSDDGLAYTFTLKPSKWSDGSDVLAADFLFAIQRLIDPATKSPLAAEAFAIAGARDIHEGRADMSALGVKAYGDLVLEITLNAPDERFAAALASPPFFPCKQEFFQETAGQYGLESDYVLSNGAFALSSWSHGSSLLLSKHDGYHDAQAVYPASVRYVIGAENPLDLLRNGGLDAAWLPAGDVSAAREDGLTLAVCEDAVRMLWFNNTNKALASRKVRAALRDSLEWNVLGGQMDGDRSRPAEGFVPPASVISGGELFRTQDNTLSVDESGPSPGALYMEGLTEQGLSESAKFTLLCADDEYSLRLARYTAQLWQKHLTLYVELDPLPADKLAARVEAGEYQIALHTMTPPDEEALSALSVFTAGHSGNLARFDDSAYTKAAASASGSRDSLEALERLLWEACPSVPIAFERRYAALAENVTGILVRPFNGSVFGAPFSFFQAQK